MKKTYGYLAVLTFVGLSLGCQGEVAVFSDDPGWSPGTANNRSENNRFTGNNLPEGVPVELTAPHLRRLTPIQFENTVRYALGDVFTQDDLPEFGDDIPIIGLNNNPDSLRVNDVNVDSLYNAIQALAQAAVEGTPVVQQCVAAADDVCWGAMIDDVGHKLWRRPVTDVERQDLLGARAQMAPVATRAEQAEFIVMALIGSPNTMFRREVGVDDDGILSMGQFEIASAMSYTIWNAPPDETLYQLAVDGQLDDPEVRIEQVRRMQEDPRFADAMAEFFIDYLKFEALFSKTKIGELGLTPEARQSLVEGARRDLKAAFSAPEATLLDPFRSTNFHIDQNGASFFDVPVSSGDYEVVSMDPTQRLGILSHPGFLSVHAGEGDSGIVKRGVFTLEQLLCIELGTPPANIDGTDDVPEGFDDATATSREVLTVRHSSQASCVGCHRVIDPAGFGFENYDSAGRYRTVEKGSVQIDASGELLLGPETLTYADSIGYIDALTNSEALQSCLSDTFFTYVIGNEPHLAEREALYTTFQESGGDVSALVEAIVTTPSFTARKPQEQ